MTKHDRAVLISIGSDVKTISAGYTLSAKFEVDAHKQRMLIKDHVIISANAFTGTVDIR